MADKLSAIAGSRNKIFKVLQFVDHRFPSLAALLDGRNHNLSMRSMRMTLRSENLQLRKEISSKPISVAFSAIHSMRSIIFVGAMAR